MSQVKTVSPQQLAELGKSNKLDVIDVRTPAEYREVHAAVARNVPLDSLNPETTMAGRSDNPQAPLYLICKGGGRGARACQKFIDNGYHNIVNVEGGTDAWEQAGLPVIRGKKTISLERQVRIAAGFIVLVAALLAIFVHPYFAAISAFVGAGLMFAGITDSCAMGMLIAKMPWNQVKDS